MLVQLRVDDDLYQLYAKRNPGDPRKAMEEALAAFQDLAPGIPRLVVENPELRELNRAVGFPVSSGAALIEHVKRLTSFSVAGVEVPLTPGQSQRLVQMAGFMQQPVDAYVRQQIGTMVTEKIGG